MDLRMFVAGEADESHLPLLFGFEQSLSGPVRREVQIGIVFVDDFVNLPEIQIVGLQPAQ